MSGKKLLEPIQMPERRTGMRPLAWLIGIGLLLSACGVPIDQSTTTILTPPETTESNSPLDALSAARARWASAGLDSYQFEFKDDCGECDPSLREPRDIVVWEGDGALTRDPTIESLFESVDRALDEGREVEVTYHPELGYPTEVSIDMADRAFDGGTHWIISELEPGLPGDEISLAKLEEAQATWNASRPEAYEFQTTIGCDCPLAGTIKTWVEGRRIVEWDVVFDDGSGGDISAITVDDMFEDLSEMFSSAEGVVEEGVRFTGTADYHPELGYPVWVGLDIEILDPDAELAYLPPRLIFSIHDLHAVEPSEGLQTPGDLTAAVQKWQEAGLTDYRYELRVHYIEDATYTDVYEITVRDNIVTSVSYTGDAGDEVETPEMTIDELFDLIALSDQGGSSVDVIYDHSLGYPRFIAIYGDGRTTEDVLALSIERVTPLQDGS